MRKKYVYPILALSVNVLLSACSDQAQEIAAPKENQLAQPHETKAANDHWSYEQETGPDQWGKLNAAYSACVNGKEQSPVNIEFAEVNTRKEKKEVKTHYKPALFSFLNNGHTIQASVTDSSNKMVLEGVEYKLTQFHFHTPSEHQFNGQNLDMELHLVHENSQGELAVLGVMIQEGKENKELARVWDNLSKEEAKQEFPEKELIHVESLLPADQTSFYYSGSLTTPPCTEKVQWIVFEQPIEMSKKQIETFQLIFPDNHRPVQPLHDREIVKK